MRQGGSKKKHFLIGGSIVVLLFIIFRVLSRLVSSPSDDTIDDNAPTQLLLHHDERQYPPFIDREMPCLPAEGEFDETGRPQLTVIGIDREEYEKALNYPAARFAIARADSAGRWHPAVVEASTGLRYGIAHDYRGDAYAIAIFVGPGELRVAPGMMNDGHFTPFRHTRQLALTNMDGLLYDYPNVPVVSFAD